MLSTRVSDNVIIYSVLLKNVTSNSGNVHQNFLKYHRWECFWKCHVKANHQGAPPPHKELSQFSPSIPPVFLPLYLTLYPFFPQRVGYSHPVVAFLEGRADNWPPWKNQGRYAFPLPKNCYRIRFLSYYVWKIRTKAPLERIQRQELLLLVNLKIKMPLPLGMYRSLTIAPTPFFVLCEYNAVQNFSSALFKNL